MRNILRPLLSCFLSVFFFLTIKAQCSGFSVTATPAVSTWCNGAYFVLEVSPTAPVANYFWQWLDSTGTWVNHVDGFEGTSGATTDSLVLQPVIWGYPFWMDTFIHRIFAVSVDGCVAYDTVMTIGLYDPHIVSYTNQGTHYCYGDTLQFAVGLEFIPQGAPQTLWSGYQWIVNGDTIFHPSTLLSDTMTVVINTFSDLTVSGFVHSSCGSQGIGWNTIFIDSCGYVPPIPDDTTVVDTTVGCDTVFVIIHDILYDITHDTITITLPCPIDTQWVPVVVTVTDTQYYVIVITEGIRDTLQKKVCGLGLFPNPATESITVYAPDPGIVVYTGHVFSLTGQEVLPPFTLETQSISVWVDTLAAGEYFLVLRSGVKKWVCTFVVIE